MAKSEKVKKLTNEDIRKIENLFSEMDSERSSLGLALTEELKFTLQTLRKLKSNIRKEGVVVDMPQGNYSIKRANPALQTYNVLIKNYQSLVKAIMEMLPTNDTNDGDDFDSDDL